MRMMILLLAACGTDSAPTYDCDTLARSIEFQDHTSCVVSSDSTGCPLTWGQFCNGACGSGWNVQCSGAVCQKTGDCTSSGPASAVFNYSQTRMGVRGLAVFVGGTTTPVCEFRECQ